MRVLVFSAVLVSGVLSVGVAATFQGRGAQGSKVAKIEQIKDNLYFIAEPTSGGNTVVFVTDNGVVLIDTKNAGWGVPASTRSLHMDPAPRAPRS